MNIYFELPIVAVITDYIVGVSGFTQSWRSGIASLMGTTESRLKDLKPFDCPSCMTWWVGLVYLAIVGAFSLPAVGEVAMLSLLSFPICQFLIFIREGLNEVISKGLRKL